MYTLLNVKLHIISLYILWSWNKAICHNIVAYCDTYMYTLLILPAVAYYYSYWSWVSSTDYFVYACMSLHILYTQHESTQKYVCILHHSITLCIYIYPCMYTYMYTEETPVIYWALLKLKLALKKFWETYETHKYL